jgi:hypothetical protein
MGEVFMSNIGNGVCSTDIMFTFETPSTSTSLSQSPVPAQVSINIEDLLITLSSESTGFMSRPSLYEKVETAIWNVKGPDIKEYEAAMRAYIETNSPKDVSTVFMGPVQLIRTCVDLYSEKKLNFKNDLQNSLRLGNGGKYVENVASGVDHFKRYQRIQSEKFHRHSSQVLTSGDNPVGKKRQSLFK